VGIEDGRAAGVRDLGRVVRCDSLQLLPRNRGHAGRPANGRPQNQSSQVLFAKYGYGAMGDNVREVGSPDIMVSFKMVRSKNICVRFLHKGIHDNRNEKKVDYPRNHAGWNAKGRGEEDTGKAFAW